MTKENQLKFDKFDFSSYNSAHADTPKAKNVYLPPDFRAENPEKGKNIRSEYDLRLWSS